MDRKYSLYRGGGGRVCACVCAHVSSCLLILSDEELFSSFLLSAPLAGVSARGWYWMDAPSEETTASGNAILKTLAWKPSSQSSEGLAFFYNGSFRGFSNLDLMPQLAIWRKFYFKKMMLVFYFYFFIERNNCTYWFNLCLVLVGWFSILVCKIFQFNLHLMLQILQNWKKWKIRCFYKEEVEKPTSGSDFFKSLQ